MKELVITKQYLDDLYHDCERLHPLYKPGVTGVPMEISKRIRKDTKVTAWDTLNMIISRNEL